MSKTFPDRFFDQSALKLGRLTGAITLALFALFLFSKPYVLLLSLENMNENIQSQNIKLIDHQHRLRLDLSTQIFGIDAQNNLRILSEGLVETQNGNKHVTIHSLGHLEQKQQVIEIQTTQHLNMIICDATSQICETHHLNTNTNPIPLATRLVTLNSMRLDGLVAQTLTPRSWTERLFGAQMEQITRRQNTLIVLMAPQTWLATITHRNNIIIWATLTGLLLGGHFLHKRHPNNKKTKEPLKEKENKPLSLSTTTCEQKDEHDPSIFPIPLDPFPKTDNQDKHR